MFEQFMMMVKACGEDVSLFGRDGDYDLTFFDFEGFDDDWSEIMRDYDHPAEVDALDEWLEEHCSSMEGDFYVVYHFDGFDVTVGYSSFDI